MITKISQKDTLIRDITIKEIQKALEQQLASNPESAPGKDGISYRFIDKAFSITSPLLVGVFNNLFSATELPETMKPVFFRFILKEGKDKDDVTSYRPIALMSTITRLFSKVMVNRLQPIFQNTISEDQQGFIYGRSSHFNIQRLQQLVDKMNQHPDKFQNSLIQKAFDRVSHRFLKQQLQSISIPDKVIMLIVTQQQGQVLVKNLLGMPFPITQGPRQGDPMSPLLFALVMDPLNRTVSSLLKGIDTDDELIKLKMILMADDVIATVNDETDAVIFHSLISQFEKLFNLKLNPMKYINTHYTHHSCPPDILTTFKQQITKSIQPPNGFRISTSKIQTPLWLGGFGWLDLSHQMMGRKAFYIYLPLTSTTVPSIINIRQIIQSAVNQGFTWFFFLLHYDFGTWISSQIKDKVVMTLSTSSPQTASLVEKGFGLTIRSDLHPNTPAPITTFSITSLPPDAELISHAQHKHTGSPIQPTSFDSTFKTFHESNWKDYIIIPSRARDN
ncbi:unnamed protein product [Ambrosiozyma monospora]|uniref:Unnamed protein product n=1 Tax=Ambrosiozyma monospora TaxID=43982 RepID=A0ACB5STB8_AMBMO|nr:unnamed protein product [Ambrosiozyma monospora]